MSYSGISSNASKVIKSHCSHTGMCKHTHIHSHKDIQQHKHTEQNRGIIFGLMIPNKYCHRIKEPCVCAFMCSSASSCVRAQMFYRERHYFLYFLNVGSSAAYLRSYNKLETKEYCQNDGKASITTESCSQCRRSPTQTVSQDNLRAQGQSYIKQRRGPQGESCVSGKHQTKMEEVMAKQK